MALLQVGACILDLGLSWLTILGGGVYWELEIYPPNWCWICLDDTMPSSPPLSVGFSSVIFVLLFCLSVFCYSGARANMVGNMALYL